MDIFFSFNWVKYLKPSLLFLNNFLFENSQREAWAPLLHSQSKKRREHAASLTSYGDLTTDACRYRRSVLLLAARQSDSNDFTAHSTLCLSADEEWNYPDRASDRFGVYVACLWVCQNWLRCDSVWNIQNYLLFSWPITAEQIEITILPSCEIHVSVKCLSMKLLEFRNEFFNLLTAQETVLRQFVKLHIM